MHIRLDLLPILFTHSRETPLRGALTRIVSGALSASVDSALPFRLLERGLLVAFRLYVELKHGS